MADFRRLLYVFAVVAFLVSLTVPAYAQFGVFACAGSSDNRPTRSTSYNDLAGNIILTCSGGIPETPGNAIPPTTVTVTANTNITSRITATVTGGINTQFNEALLIIDEPNSNTTGCSPTSSLCDNRTLSNCGLHGEDSSADAGTGPGVCQIIAVPDPSTTYDGLYTGTNCGGGDTLGNFGCGRPNVFQGRQAISLVGGEFNKIQFVGVPLDAPGTAVNRILRFANIRVDSTKFGPASPFSTVPVTATVSLRGHLNLDVTTIQIATVELGMQSDVFDGLGFLQCVGTDQHDGTSSKNPFWPGSSGIDPNGKTRPTMDIRLIENFSSAWRVRNVALLTEPGNGVLEGFSYVCSDAACFDLNPGWTATDDVQNTPGNDYGTEAGFENNSANNVPDPNPPAGFGSPVVGGFFNFFANNGFGPTTTTRYTGIAKAGEATQGTRIAIQVGSIPNGARLFFPITVQLQDQAGGGVTGVMQVDGGADATGFGGNFMFTAASPTQFDFIDSGDTSPTTVVNDGSLTDGVTYVEVTNSTPVITYEILFARNDALEFADVIPTVVYNNNGLATDLPQTGVPATATVSFAPIQSGKAHPERPQSDSYATPRFLSEFKATPDPLFEINKCACNLLFPWVVSAGNIDTGIVVANTSLDPCGGAAPCPVPGFGAASPQVGKVTFYYFGTVGIGDQNPVANLAPNTSNTVAAGGYVAHVLSQNTSATNGLGSRTNFAGYVIAQANFQWCHGVVDITQGSGVIFNYVGLQLDGPPFLVRTGLPGESLGH